jgi:hypothetical protein
MNHLLASILTIVAAVGIVIVLAVIVASTPFEEQE